MATNFPTTLDSYSAVVDTVTDVLAVHINDPRDAIVQLETKVGVNSSAVTTTLDYKVTQLIAGTGMSGSSQATAFIPTGSTVPTNGLYLPSANSPGIASNSVQRLRFNSAGLMGFSGGGLAIDSTYGRLNFATGLGTGRLTTDAGNEIISIHSYFDATVMELSAASTAGLRTGVVIRGGGATTRPGSVSLYTDDNEVYRVLNTGAHSFFAPNTAGTNTVTITGVSSSPAAALVIDGTTNVSSYMQYKRSGTSIGYSGADDALFSTNGGGSTYLALRAENGLTLGVSTVARLKITSSTIQIADSNNTLYNAGYLEVPVITTNASTSFALADSGKAWLHTDGSAYTWTIPANGSVAYPVGTTLTMVNDGSAGNITIAITTDTLVWIPAGTTGSRTLAINGRATAVKITSTRWQISGIGLT